MFNTFTGLQRCRVNWCEPGVRAQNVPSNAPLIRGCRALTGAGYRCQFVSCLSHDSLIHPLSGHLSPKGKSILSSALYKCSVKCTDILVAGKKLGPSRQTSKSEHWCSNMGSKCSCFVFSWILSPNGWLCHVSFITSCITSYAQYNHFFVAYLLLNIVLQNISIDHPACSCCSFWLIVDTGKIND